jgi:hypothetical protein
MKRLRIAATVVLLLLCGAFVGCGGGGAKMETSTTTVTLGKQLMDLDKAYKEGAIDEKQYKKSKEDLLKKYY